LLPTGGLDDRGQHGPIDGRVDIRREAGAEGIAFEDVDVYCHAAHNPEGYARGCQHRVELLYPVEELFHVRSISCGRQHEFSLLPA
jgi:hypothetical protein